MTYWAEVMVTLQVPVPEQPAPLQPAKVEPVEATAERVTTVLGLKLKAQVVPQSIPTGELVTRPSPLPAFETVRAYLLSVKVAETDTAAFMVTLQVPTPVQAPLQPAKVESEEASAVRVTGVPLAKSKEQVAPQSMPAGELVTDPVPVPVLLTVRVKAVCVPVGVFVRVGVLVRVGVFVLVRVGVNVDVAPVEVAVGVLVRVGVLLTVGVLVRVGVLLAVGVLVRVGDGEPVFVRVGVLLTVGVLVRVGVDEAVFVRVGVLLAVGVEVLVRVGVGVKVGVEVLAAKSNLTLMPPAKVPCWAA